MKRIKHIVNNCPHELDKPINEIQESNSLRGKLSEKIALLPNDFAFHGDMPEMRRFRKQEEIEEFLISGLKSCIEEEG